MRPLELLRAWGVSVPPGCLITFGQVSSAVTRACGPRWEEAVPAHVWEGCVRGGGGIAPTSARSANYHGLYAGSATADGQAPTAEFQYLSVDQELELLDVPCEHPLAQQM